MKVITVPYEKLSADCYRKAVDDGYNWGCECGESYMSQEGAENCRKCRVYLEETPTTVYFTPSKNS